MEWVEVEAPSVPEAIELAVRELGLGSPEEVDVEVIREAKKGFLGVGAQDALVKVLPKPKQESSRRRRSRRGSRSQGSSQAPSSQEKSSSGTSGGRQGGQADQRGKPDGQSRSRSSRERRPRPSGDKTSDNKGNQRRTPVNDKNGKETPYVSVEEQGDVAKEFLEGLLSAFGLEGVVESRVEEEVLYLDVSGDQTEALVGAKGSIMHSVLELTRTVVQRKTYGAPRMRLDIAGYAERRREALKIYAGKLAERVLEDGGEVMLEPMNPADRKVVHDAIAEIEGVRSYSEGEEPERCVIVAKES